MFFTGLFFYMREREREREKERERISAVSLLIIEYVIKCFKMVDMQQNSL